MAAGLNGKFFFMNTAFTSNSKLLSANTIGIDDFFGVSICVISYNSSLTILETLNSILAQNYPLKHIEIVISDDASNDETQKIIDTWVKNNSYKFYDVKVFLNKVNQGVTKNCNTAWSNASKHWIKSIAADDILLPNCILSNILFCSKNQCDVVFSLMNIIGREEKTFPSKFERRFFHCNTHIQNLWIKSFLFNIAPTGFISRNALIKVGLGDIRYRNIEDLPLWIKLSNHGYHFMFLNEVTVGYRIAESLTKSTKKIVNPSINLETINIYKDIKNSFSIFSFGYYLSIGNLIMHRWVRLLSKLFKNRKNTFYMIIKPLILLLLPIHLFYYLVRALYR